MKPNFVPKGPIDNKPELVQVMDWHRIGDKLLPEPIMAQFNDAYMRHRPQWKKKKHCEVDDFSENIISPRCRIYASVILVSIGWVSK